MRKDIYFGSQLQPRVFWLRRFEHVVRQYKYSQVATGRGQAELLTSCQPGNKEGPEMIQS